MKDKICKMCGEKFTPTSNAQGYCDKCKAEKTIKTKICAGCGDTFVFVGTQKYCLKCKENGTDNRIRRQQSNPYWDDEKKIVVKRVHKKPDISVDEFCRMAKSAGLSYGHYADRIRKGLAV